MIEDVKELETNFQYSIFPTRNLRVLHDAEIGIEIVRIAETVTTLSEGNQRPVIARV